MKYVLRCIPIKWDRKNGELVIGKPYMYFLIESTKYEKEFENENQTSGRLLALQWDGYGAF